MGITAASLALQGAQHSELHCLAVPSAWGITGLNREPFCRDVDGQSPCALHCYRVESSHRSVDLSVPMLVLLTSLRLSSL